MTLSSDQCTDERLIIFDTDCGVDDAVALTLLMRFNELFGHSTNQRIKLLGITCVGGNTHLKNVTVNVRRVVKVCEMQTKCPRVPVYAGCNIPLTGSKGMVNAEFVHGSDGLGDSSSLQKICVDDYTIEAKHAAQFIVDSVRKYPNKVELIAVGPLTNVAMAYLLDPSIARLTHTLHVMGGNDTGRGNIGAAGEFNFYCDPTAAKVVLEDFDCRSFITTWECTLNNRMKTSSLMKMFTADTPLSRLACCALRNCVAEYYPDPEKQLPRFDDENATIADGPSPSIPSGMANDDSLSGMTICDAISVFAALFPEHITRKHQRHATVETSLHGHVRGMCVLDWREEKRHADRLSTTSHTFVQLCDPEVVESVILKTFIAM